MLDDLSALAVNFGKTIPKTTAEIAPTSTADASVSIIIGCWQCLMISLELSTWTGGRIVVALVVEALKKQSKDIV